MSDYTDAYVDLLIKQYWDQPRARAEIDAAAAGWETQRDVLDAFRTEFDVDLATADRLDKIGAIVGIPRNIPYVIPKRFFGFEDNPLSGGFDSLSAPYPGLPPFYRLDSPTYEALELSDADYRTLIRAKIARNSALPNLASSDAGSSLQEAVNVIFGGEAYVVDNLDMSLALYVSPSFSTDLLNAVLNLDLLPRPQGVQYYYIVQSVLTGTFGFSNNPNTLGFGSLFDPSRVGGTFARLVIL